MKTVDVLLKNARVLTMDEQMNQYEAGAVAVVGDRIFAVGPESEITQEYAGIETIDARGKLLMPGLVNAHTHVPMTLMRGLADDLRLDVWLLGYMMPVEREFVSPEFVRLGTLLGCAELIRSGVTCFNDMYYFEEVVPAVAAHAPYTCTAEILQETARVAMEFDVPLHIHLAETSYEVENMRRENGFPVVPYVKKQGLLEAKVIAAHCVHIDTGEMRTLLHAGAGVAHNPSSNLKLASGFAPVMKMLETGIQVGIGTDGPASNNDLDMFEELRLTAFVAKAVSNEPTSLPASLALTMATRMGAHALHLGKITGSLTPGLRADLILVDISGVHNSPSFTRSRDNLYAQIVYAGKSTDVSDVMVNGKWLMRDRQLLSLDEDALIRQAAEIARRVDSFLIEREQSVLSKLVALGGSMEQESFEVQVKVKVTDAHAIREALTRPEIEVVRYRHYDQHDSYFTFEDPLQGRLRYREDDFLDETGNVTMTRPRLTHLGQQREDAFAHNILLSRSRFLAAATQSLRFYREYFRPKAEGTVEKDRERWLVRFKDTEFFVNVDRMIEPSLGLFVEIKSRTWSRKDAEHKAILTNELLAVLGIANSETVTEDYFEVAKAK